MRVSLGEASVTLWGSGLCSIYQHRACVSCCWGRKGHPASFEASGRLDLISQRLETSMPIYPAYISESEVSPKRALTFP